MEYKDLFINKWVEIIFGFIAAGLVALYKKLSSKLKKQACDQNALKDGTLALLRNEIIHSYDKYIYRKWIPIYARENVLKLYEAYHQLGGNGAIDKLIEEIEALSSNDPNEQK